MSRETEDTIECGKCGAIIPITAKKCPVCGVVLYGDEAGKELRPPISSRQGSQNLYDNGPNSVLIVNFNMPFWSIVTFMVKVAIASIPAMIIMSIISLVLWAIFGGLFYALLR